MIAKFDIKLQKYFKLFESTRTTELEVDEFKRIINENCKDFIKSPYLIQRYKSYYDGLNYAYIDPKKHIRIQRSNDDGSGVCSNHSLLLMDNLKSWSLFPKRSQSVIGLSGASNYSDFGEYIYFVIPFDGAKFGVAPASDIWSCYVRNSSAPHLSIRFNDLLSYDLLDIGVSDKSYDDMIGDLYRVYNENKLNLSEYYYIRQMFDYITEYCYSENIINFKDGLSNFLNPYNFEVDKSTYIGFETMNYDKLKDIKNREVWSDSECLIVYVKKIGSSSLGVKNKEDVEDAFDELLKSLKLF